ncbi:MAG: hypothetical protein NT150_12350 [Bacteroidetes bacterium]|nr:hypothetical protein [Bacteroidota bacterium]
MYLNLPSYIRSKAMTFALFFSIISLGLSAQTQATEVVFQGWKLLGESSKTVDITAKVISCDGVNQVLLNVFNESMVNQDVDFTVTIVNEDNREVSKNIKVEVSRMKMKVAACGDATYDDLKINLPLGFNPATVKLSIVFN